MYVGRNVVSYVKKNYLNEKCFSHSNYVKEKHLNLNNY